MHRFIPLACRILPANTTTSLPSLRIVSSFPETRKRVSLPFYGSALQIKYSVLSNTGKPKALSQATGYWVQGTVNPQKTAQYYFRSSDGAVIGGVGVCPENRGGMWEVRCEKLVGTGYASTWLKSVTLTFSILWWCRHLWRRGGLSIS